MSYFSVKTLAVVTLGLFLAGCGIFGGNNGGNNAVTGIDTLGAGFVNAFGADANAAPVDPTAIGDFPPVNFTQDPFNP